MCSILSIQSTALRDGSNGASQGCCELPAFTCRTPVQDGDLTSVCFRSETEVGAVAVRGFWRAERNPITPAELSHLQAVGGLDVLSYQLLHRDVCVRGGVCTHASVCVCVCGWVRLSLCMRE